MGPSPHLFIPKPALPHFRRKVSERVVPHPPMFLIRFTHHLHAKGLVCAPQSSVDGRKVVVRQFPKKTQNLAVARIVYSVVPRVWDL